MKKIILVEDDTFLIEIYSTKIKEAGFELVLAKDGEEVLRKIQEEKPNLLLLDIVLPGIDGWEVLRRIRKDSGLKDLKIIAFSNLSQKDEEKKSLEFGVTKYLMKANYTPSQVIEEIKKVLE